MNRNSEVFLLAPPLLPGHAKAFHRIDVLRSSSLWKRHGCTSAACSSDRAAHKRLGRWKLNSPGLFLQYRGARGFTWSKALTVLGLGLRTHPPTVKPMEPKATSEAMQSPNCGNSSLRWASTRLPAKPSGARPQPHVMAPERLKDIRGWHHLFPDLHHVLALVIQCLSAAGEVGSSPSESETLDLKPSS